MPSLPPELMLQLGFRPLQSRPLGFGQGLAGAVDVEGQHRERGAVGAELATGAVFGRALQGCSDLFRVGQCEDAALDIERVALLGDALGPAVWRGRF